MTNKITLKVHHYDAETKEMTAKDVTICAEDIKEYDCDHRIMNLPKNDKFILDRNAFYYLYLYVNKEIKNLKPFYEQYSFYREDNKNDDLLNNNYLSDDDFTKLVNFLRDNKIPIELEEENEEKPEHNDSDIKEFDLECALKAWMKDNLADQLIHDIAKYGLIDSFFKREIHKMAVEAAKGLIDG